MNHNQKNFPITLFVYNRLDKVVKTLNALKKNNEFKDSAFFVYSDAAKSPKEKEAVDKVRSYISKLSLKNMTVIYRETNFGINQNFMTAITSQLETNDAVIIVDDDTIVSPYFLKFMNESLYMYMNEERVGAVCGYAPKYFSKIKEDTFFLYWGAAWGWGVWKRSWKNFSYQATDYWNELHKRKLTKVVTLNNYIYWYEENKHIIDLQFCMYMVLNNMLVLYPSKSLLKTIGADGSGIHTPKTNKHKATLTLSPIQIKKTEIKEHMQAKREHYKFHKKKYIKHHIRKKTKSLLSIFFNRK